MNESNQDEPDSSSPYAGLAGKIRTGKSASKAEYDSTPPKILIAHRTVRSGGQRGVVKALALIFDPLLNPPLRVELDGVIVGSIPEGETLELTTSAGPHRLRILAMICSATKDIEITNGQRFKFWCHTVGTGVVFQRDH